MFYAKKMVFIVKNHDESVKLVLSHSNPLFKHLNGSHEVKVNNVIKVSYQRRNLNQLIPGVFLPCE